jgi:hypothetical protein
LSRAMKKVIFAQNSNWAMENSYVLKNDKGERYVEVAVTPATKKYFTHINRSKDGFVRTRIDSLLGLTLAIGTQRDLYRKRSVRRKPPGNKIKLVLSESLDHGKITDLTLGTIGMLLDKMFRECFFMYVRGAAKTGCSDNFAIVKFLDEFGITEDDWNVDTAKKAYRDYMGGAPGYEARTAGIRQTF